MLTLALDTSANVCAVALHDSGSGRIVSTIRQETQSGHAELLFGLVAKALAESGAGYPSISRVAAVRGPGSFTGIRIALASARGLALAHGIPAIGIDAFTAHFRTAAKSIDTETPVLVALDARRGEVFATLFARTGGADHGEPLVGTPQQVLAHYQAGLGSNVRICGSGADKFGLQFGAPLHSFAAPDIDEVAYLGAAADPAQNPPVPLYIRPADARPPERMAVARAVAGRPASGAN